MRAHPLRIHRDLDGLGASSDGYLRPVKWRRCKFNDEVCEAIHGDGSGRRAAHDREDLRCGDTTSHGVFELLDRGNVTFEVAFEHVVVGDDDALDEVVVDLMLAVDHVLRDVRCFRRARVVEVCLVPEQVGDSVE